MEHMLVKATVTEATDQGTFSAVISTVSIDRDGDIVEPGAVVNALHKWGTTGKKIPLSWNHGYDADEIIGHIEPESAHELNGEVVADGWVDQSTDRGKNAWRLVKSGTLGFSYGFLALDAAPRDGGKGLHITSLDIFEITATPIPANAETRVLSFKSAADLRSAAEALEREEEERQIPHVEVPPDPEPEPEPEPDPEPEPQPVEALKSTAAAVEREEEERTIPDVEVVEAEPVLEEKTNGMAGLMQRMRQLLDREEAPTADEMLGFARRVTSELGGKSAEAIKAETAAVENAELARAVADLQAENFDAKTAVADAKEALEAQEHFEPGEVEGMKAGLLKAVWTTAYINDLPDSSFLHVASGGDKDSEGKTTPRSLRYFPYKDANGTVDLPHLRNALSRIPQSSLPQDVKDRLTARAQRILDNSKAVDATGKEEGANGRGPRSVDPLRKVADAVALEFASDGLDRRKPPRQVERPKPQPELDTGALRRRTYDEILSHLSEGE